MLVPCFTSYHPQMEAKYTPSILLAFIACWAFCLTTAPKQGEMHTVHSNTTSPVALCQRFAHLFNLRRPGVSTPVNKLFSSFKPKDPTHLVSFTQHALNPAFRLGPEHKQQALQEKYHLLALQNANPHDKLTQIQQLLPMGLNYGSIGAENVYNKDIVLQYDISHCGIYYGEIHSTSRNCSGLGVYFGTAFPHIYVGNWSCDFKHGYGVTLMVSESGFIAEGYEWRLGMAIKRWNLPTSLKNACVALDKCTFLGIKTLVELLRLCPRFPTVEGPPEDTRELLENNAIYRIELAEGDGRHLEILDGKTDSGVSLVPIVSLDNCRRAKFVCKSKGNNRYYFMPFHNSCDQLVPSSKEAGEGTNIVQQLDSPYTMHVWKVEKNNSDSLSIKFEATGLYWEASEKGKFDVHLAHKKSTRLQRFVFIKQSNTADTFRLPAAPLKEGQEYVIKNNHYSTYLSRKDDGASDNTPIISDTFSKDSTYNHMIWKAIQGSIDAKANPNIWQFQATGITSPKNIDVYAGSKQPGGKLVLYKAHSGANQQFELIPISENSRTFQLRVVNSGLCLRCYCSNGVAQEKCNVANTGQHFTFYESSKMAMLVDSKEYMIEAKHNSKLLSHNNKKVYLERVKSKGKVGEKQIFVAKHHGDDVYSFHPKALPNQALGMKAKKKTISLLPASTPSTKWGLEKSGDLFYRLKNMSTNNYMLAGKKGFRFLPGKKTEGNDHEFSFKAVSND